MVLGSSPDSKEISKSDSSMGKIIWKKLNFDPSRTVVVCSTFNYYCIIYCNEIKVLKIFKYFCNI
jgi:hypothetical protein